MTPSAGRIIGFVLVVALVVVGGYVLTRGRTATPSEPTVVAPTVTIMAASSTPESTPPVMSPTAPLVVAATVPSPTSSAVPSPTPVSGSAVPPTPSLGGSPSPTHEPAATRPVPTSAASTPRVPRSGGTPGAAPIGASQAVEFVARPGADPLPIARQIAGPNATIRHPPGGGAPPPLSQQQRLARTWLVPVAPGTEAQALARARQDPDVEAASLVHWPPTVSNPM